MAFCLIKHRGNFTFTLVSTETSQRLDVSAMKTETVSSCSSEFCRCVSYEITLHQVPN